MKVVLFCVNYNSYQSLNSYLDSLDKAKDLMGEQLDLTVIVVDNSEITERIAENLTFKLKQICTNENLGYFGGISYGIYHSNILLSECDYIIISNVDLIVSESLFVNLKRFQPAKDVGCIAPAIMSKTENGNRNPKIMERPSKNKLEILRFMYRFPFLHKLYSRLMYSKRREKVQNADDGYIYAAHGSFMIFTKSFAEYLQTMRYSCFLFGEEIFISENLKRYGLKVFYTSSIVVNDSEHISTGKMKSSFYYKCNYDAIDMLLKEYFHE